MSTKQPVVLTNQLLDGLPPRERDRFLADCTLVDLVLGNVLHEQGDRIRHVYFPIESFISILATVDRHSMLEVSMVGNEGMYGHSLLLGSDVAPLRSLTQGAGAAWRMKAATFHQRLEDMPALRPLLHRYLTVLLRQMAQTSACTRFHVVEKRLARWLLMSQDRAHADSFDVTHEFLAYMLGVRRVGVTKAAGLLQLRKLIRYKRGKVTILNRQRLEGAACSCYQSDLEAYQRVMRH